MPAAAFDPALRKTVSCPVLEAAFAKNPHPDGKTMHALAEKLKLNKKQVSNFFERERRKANIVIESRRKGSSNAGGGGSSGNSSSSGSVNGSATKISTSKKKLDVVSPESKGWSSSTAKLQRGDSADKPFIPSSSIAIAEKNRQSSNNEDAASVSSELPNKRSRRTVKQGSYFGAFDDENDEDEHEFRGFDEEDGEDAEGEEYEDDNTGEYEEEEEGENDAPFPAKKARANTATLEIEESIELAQVPQNPLVQKNKLESSLTRSSNGVANGHNASTRYTARNARYASRSPLYAFPATQALDNFRTAPPSSSYNPYIQQPIMRRTASASPSIISRSTSPLAPGTVHAQAHSNALLLTSFGTSTKSNHLAAPPSLYTLKHGSRASSLVDEETSTFGGSSTGKRKRRMAASESPTVMFLRNPFPAPVPTPQSPQAELLVRPELQRSVSIQSMRAEEEFEDHLENALSEFNLDPHQPMMRKRARVWFSKPSGESESADLSNESITNTTSQESSKGRSGKSTVEASFSNSNEPRPVRNAAVKRTDNKGKLAEQNISDNDMDNSEESDFAEEEDLDIKAKKKRDNRPGAALRTNIACTELRQAFLANPHPAAHVLEALATRLGLGKKQVSNYFVRERKKAGYTIKVRHGLHRRRGPNKKKLDKPEVVITQHDVDMPADLSFQSQSGPFGSHLDDNMSGMTAEENDDIGSEDDESIKGSQMDDMTVDSYTGDIDPALLAGNKDDVPDLSYDEQDIASTTRATFLGSNSNVSGIDHMSSFMVVSKSMDSMTTTSRQDEDEELASPPFEAVQLPSQLGDGKAELGHHNNVFSFSEQHALAPNTSLQYV